MKHSYIGPETTKALANFSFTQRVVEVELFYALAEVKAAAALANEKAGVLPSQTARTIVQVCDEIIAGRHDTSWVTDALQGGAGTSMNMNINELIALRSEELLALPPGSIHPIDQVNAGQSTNDVIPTAIRLTLIWRLDEYVNQLDHLKKVIKKKIKQVKTASKVGRTHLQDAVPIPWKDILAGYNLLIDRDVTRLSTARDNLLFTNLGGTAVGTSIGATQKYLDSVHIFLNQRTHLSFRPASNFVDATQNIDPLVHVTQLLELSALSFSKVVNDWRLMNSGPRAGLSEVTVPPQQKGSSIMPGKVNPVLLEAYNQVSYQVSGNSQVARLVLLNGQFELNVMLPVFIKTTLESLRLVISGIQSLALVMDQTVINIDRCQFLLDQSLCYATALNEQIGYDAASEIVNAAIAKNMTLAEVLEEKGISLRV